MELWNYQQRSIHVNWIPINIFCFLCILTRWTPVPWQLRRIRTSYTTTTVQPHFLRRNLQGIGSSRTYLGANPSILQPSHQKRPIQDIWTAPSVRWRPLSSILATNDRSDDFVIVISNIFTTNWIESNWVCKSLRDWNQQKQMRLVQQILLFVVLILHSRIQLLTAFKITIKHA